jgi:hypothetical protein
MVDFLALLKMPFNIAQGDTIFSCENDLYSSFDNLPHQQRLPIAAKLFVCLFDCL